MSRPTVGLGADWWREGVFYQVYPRSFQDSDGDGVGDLRGITARLDHLAGGPDSLGIDAIWISPFYPSPMADFGYDVADYCDVHPLFGTLADFDELLAQAHRRGVRIIVDLVPNHTSSEHPWFLESRSSRDNPRRDWYVWADPAPGGGPPNDWKNVFGRGRQPAWTWDERTGQYYLHSFLAEQPDLNWWNPEVRAAFEAIMRFWLDRGVDGFRIDVVHKTVKPRDLGAPIGENPRGTPDTTPPADEVELHALLRTWRKLLDEYDDRMAVGECVVFDPDRLVAFYGRDADELHLAFNFMFLRAPWSADAFRERVETFEELLHRDAWPDYTLSNHDNSRARSRYQPAGDPDRGERRARLSALMLLTLRGTPFIYYGEEIGMTDGYVPADRIVDVAGRDPCRTPMQWDGSDGAGFTTGQPWLPIGIGAPIGVSVAAQRGDPRSMFSWYRAVIRERRGSPALRRGSYRTLSAPRGLYAYLREASGDRRLVVLNFWGRPRRFTVPDDISAEWRVVLSSDPDRAIGGPVGRTVLVGADEGLLLAG